MGIILVLICLGGYFSYGRLQKKENQTQYLLSALEKWSMLFQFLVRDRLKV